MAGPGLLSTINRALRMLGERPITNPDAPETPAGKHMVEIFDQTRREVLRRHPWNFAEVWAEIDKTTDPAFGYNDAYALPQDFVRLLVVGYTRIHSVESEDFDSRRDFRLLYQPAPDFRRVIALNNAGESTLKISYTADVDKLHIWDPLAIKVLALWLALDAAKSITGQDRLISLLNQMLTEELRDAAGVDGNEQAIRLHLESHVQAARRRAQYADSYLPFVDFQA